MPASMMSADTGGSAYVVGNSIAIVATGPMPGSTPISVPISEPNSAYRRLTGLNATPNPNARWLKSSMSFASSAELGPDRQLNMQADHEHTDTNRRQDHAGDDRFLGTEF